MHCAGRLRIAGLTLGHYISSWGVSWRYFSLFGYCVMRRPTHCGIKGDLNKGHGFGNSEILSFRTNFSFCCVNDQFLVRFGGGRWSVSSATSWPKSALTPHKGKKREEEVTRRQRGEVC